MQPTKFLRLTLPPLALVPGGRVNAVCTAPRDIPVRLLILNLSGAQVFFAAASESLIGPDAPGNDVFELPPQREIIFVLAPGQALYGAANGAGALISISVSEALPEQAARV